MSKLLPEISPADIKKLLPVSVDKSKIKGDLIELDDSASLSQARKRFFRLRLDGHPDLHLSYGEGLKDTYERSKAFNTALPQYTCKPVFIVEDGERHLFGQEFFDGQPIDKCLESGKITEQEITSVLQNLYDALDSLKQASTRNALVDELEENIKTFLSNEYLTDIDRNILSNYLYPSLIKELGTLNPSLRYSPGDLAARNVLLKEEGEFRIIDCEFAEITHFHEEDIIRIATFSLDSFKKLKIVKEKFMKVPNAMNAYFWIRQCYLDSRVNSREEYLKYAQENLKNIDRELYFKYKGDGTGSIILNGIKFEQEDLKKKLGIQIKKVTDLEDKLYNKNKILNETTKELREVKKNSNEIAKDLEDTIKLSNKLKSEISDKETLLQKRIKEAEQANKEQLNIKKELDIVHHELKVKNGKIKRMKDSFSWKFTKILRLIRRHTIDKYKKNHRYKELRFYIDNFKIINLNDKFLLNIEGWAHTEFKQVDSIYIQIGNRIEILEYNVSRPDLKNTYNNLAPPYLFGFSKRINMNLGFKNVQLYAKVNSRKYILGSKLFKISNYDIKKIIFWNAFKLSNITREGKLKLSYLNNLHKFDLKKESELTIVIPVYKNILLTKRCIDSVLETIRVNKTKFQILVLNDNSPEEKLNSYISNLDNENIVVVNNSYNIGFVGTVNKGFLFTNPNLVLLKVLNF